MTESTYRQLTMRLGRLGPRYLCLVVLAVAISGCINSKLVIKPLYNRLDNQMRSQFSEIGNFNKEQNRAINQSIGTFHVWHRQSELPRYAAWIRDLAGSIASTDATTAEDVERWSVSLAEHMRRSRECHPIRFLLDEVPSLSDKQVDYIEKQYYKELQEDIERFASKSPEERVKQRLKNIDKWAGRISLDLTPAQLSMIRESLEEQVSMSQFYRGLADEWNTEMFALVRDRANPDFVALMTAHMSQRGSMLSTAHPDEWQQNRDLWQRTFRDLVTSLSPSQRRESSRWLTVFANTLDKISRDKPSFKVSNDASIGCLVVSSN